MVKKIKVGADSSLFLFLMAFAAVAAVLTIGIIAAKANKRKYGSPFDDDDFDDDDWEDDDPSLYQE